MNENKHTVAGGSPEASETEKFSPKSQKILPITPKVSAVINLMPFV